MERRNKALKLPILLEREALAIWFEFIKLTARLRKNECSKKQTLKKVTPMKSVTLEEFYQRKLHPDGVLPLPIHDLNKLLDQLMPEAEQTVEGNHMKKLE